MNYETEIKARRESGDTAAEIATAINADRRAEPKNWRPLKSHEVANWLASNGLESRVEKWLTLNSASPEFDLFKSAFEGIKAMRGNTEAIMRVAPGQDHRNLILLAISKGAMQQVDLTHVDSIAYIGVEETAETVQAAIDRYESDPNRWQRFVNAGPAVIEGNGTLSAAITAGNAAAGVE